METSKNRTSTFKAIVLSGLIAGTVFLVLELFMVPVFLGGSVWGPPRMIAAIALGSSVLPPPATFELGMFMTAAVVHFSLSILYTYILSFFIVNRTLTTGLAIGAIFGFGLYLINFYLFTAAFPWFAEARNWVSIFSHLMFGIVASWSFIGIFGKGIPETAEEERMEKAEKKKEKVEEPEEVY